MTGSPLLPRDRKKKPKPRLDPMQRIKKNCYTALIRDAMFAKRYY